MIGYIEGKLLKKEEDRILLLANQLGYEVLLPAIVMETMNGKTVGDEIALYIYYQQTEKQPKPVLIGFNREEEKDFFQQFISVEDIGPLKAVKALNVPSHDIAAAIESKDAGKLKQLKGIGNRTAQKIIAALSGKMDRFLIGPAGERAEPLSNDFSKAVLEVLVEKLGHKPVEAGKMIREATKRNQSIASPEELLDEIYRGETG